MICPSSQFSQGNLHDRYGHIVALYAKYISLKIEFHAKVTQNISAVRSVRLRKRKQTDIGSSSQHKVIPGNLEATDETLEREAGNDMTKV